MTNRWLPLGAHRTYRPEAGNLLAHLHAVWHVERVADLELTAADREVWLEAGCPDLETWRGRPYRIECTHVAGARPDWATPDGPIPPCHLDVPAEQFRTNDWHVYPASGRWPQCSCCGEPMPCRADVEDREVTKGMKEIAKHVRKKPGHCWACDEPITRRQKFVLYVGDNLDLPGAAAPRFHTRSACRGWAERYELRWIAVDPRRERILTYPKCDGILVFHADGITECRSGEKPLLGDLAVSEPDCRGHLTHDHAVQVSCYVGEEYMAHPSKFPGCPRGCDPNRHRGVGRVKRPERRDSNTLT